jgi:hypothetical protein
MLNYPPPVLQEIEGVLVVRDDLIEGGTKVRALSQFMDRADEFIYASPAQGYAQLALAIACRAAGKQATVFVAKRNQLHPITAKAKESGARIVQVPYGYMSNVHAKAKEYCVASGAFMFPFGFDFPEFINELSRVAKTLSIEPREVWCVAGSGVLSRALQQAYPKAKIKAVRIGAVPEIAKADLYTAPEKFEQNAKQPPPFPSCSNYDAKAWQFIKQYAQPGALFWNVAGDFPGIHIKRMK